MPNRFSQASVLPYEPLPVEGLMKIGMLADENAQKAYDLAEAKLEYLGNIPTYYPGDKETIKNKINEANKQLADVTKTGSITDITNKVNGIYNQFTRDPLVNSIIERTDTGVKMDEWMDKNAKNLTDAEKSDWNILKSRFMSGTLDPKDQELIQKGMRLNTKFDLQKSFENAKKSMNSNKYILSQQNGVTTTGEGYFGGFQDKDIKDPITGKVISPKGAVLGDPRIINYLAYGQPDEAKEQILRNYASQMGILTSEVDPKKFQEYKNNYAQGFADEISHNIKYDQEETPGASWTRLAWDMGKEKQIQNPTPRFYYRRDLNPDFSGTESQDISNENLTKGTLIEGMNEGNLDYKNSSVDLGFEFPSELIVEDKINPTSSKKVFRVQKQIKDNETANLIQNYTIGDPGLNQKTTVDLYKKALFKGIDWVRGSYGFDDTQAGPEILQMANSQKLKIVDDKGNSLEGVPTTSKINLISPFSTLGENKTGPVFQGQYTINNPKDGTSSTKTFSIEMPESTKPLWGISYRLRDIVNQGKVGVTQTDGRGEISDKGNVYIYTYMNQGTRLEQGQSIDHPEFQQVIVKASQMLSNVATESFLLKNGLNKSNIKGNRLETPEGYYYFTPDNKNLLLQEEVGTPSEVDNDAYLNTLYLLKSQYHTKTP